ncbi:secreted protein [Melampsora americana]|nr:secreted protein [Melampsora americana]
MFAYMKIMILFLVLLGAGATKVQNPFCTDTTGHPNVQQLTRAANNMGDLVTRGTWKACGAWNVSIDRASPALKPPTGFSVTREIITNQLNILLAKKCKYGYITFNSQGNIELQIDTALASPPAPECN